MKDPRPELSKILLRFSPKEGLQESPLPGVHIIKVSKPYPRSKQHWRAALYLIAQGSKEIILGHETYRCGVADYIATPLDLPVTSRVLSATPEKPFLSLKIVLDPLALSEVASQLEQDFSEGMEDSLRAMYIGKVGEPMLEAALRLANLFAAPKDAAVLGPLVIKEMLYHLLKGPDGPAIQQFARSGSITHKIAQAIYSLKTDLSEEVDATALAKTAHMSRSAFFQHFREVTAMSPIQYQKRLRLLEARRLMIEEGETAEGSAYKVGYNSASQFSREYSRMFGNAPIRDALRVKRTGRSVHQV